MNNNTTTAIYGKERIRRAGTEISKTHPNVDTGFRVFKLDKSNFKIWDDSPVDPKSPDEIARLMGQLSYHADSPFIDGRSHKDIVYEIMRMNNYPLTTPIIPIEINGETVWDYAQVFDNFADFKVNTKTNAVLVENSFYNYIKYDREKVELRFAEKVDIDTNVELFLKLPAKKFTISTPVGLYTPDWAIVKRNIHGKQQTIYFVVETKGDSNDEQQREVERVKIECAQKHFEALGFEVVPNAPLVDKGSKYVVKTDYRDFALEG